MNPTLPTCEYTLKNTKIGKVQQPYKPKRPPACKIFCKPHSLGKTRARKGKSFTKSARNGKSFTTKKNRKQKKKTTAL